MTKEIGELVKELCNKEVSYIDYEGKNTTTNLIFRDNKDVVEQIVTKHLIENRDKKVAELEAKIFVYEQIIYKSNFSSMVNKILTK